MSQLVTLGIAVVGAVLGIYNAVRDWRRDSERLKVIPKSSTISTGEAAVRDTLAIELVNLSPFPVTVTEVGFLLKGTPRRKVIENPVIPDSGDWPRRVEARSSVTVFARADQDFFWIERVTKAYAVTATGCQFKGSSERLRWMIAHGQVPTDQRRIAGRPGLFVSAGDPDE